MSRSKRDTGDWTRRESLHVDGRLEDASASRKAASRKAEGPPELEGEHLHSYREAMDLWREDAEIGASTFDAEAILRGVLEGAGSRESLGRVTRRYAAAAVLLIGVGVAGAATVGGSASHGAEPSVRSALETLEQNQLGLIAEQEWTRFGITTPTGSEEER